MLDFAFHFRPGDPSEWITILAVVAGLAALFIFLWLRKGSVVDFLDPQTLKTPPERALDAFHETIAASRKAERLAHAVIWGVFALLSGLAAALTLSMTVLGAVLRSGDAAELGIGLGIALGLGLVAWFFVFALRDEWRHGQDPSARIASKQQRKGTQ